MKKLLLLSFLLMFTFNVTAQKDYSEDVKSIDSIIDALYASISGDKGEARDWDRFKNLFIPEAKLMPTGLTPQGEAVYRNWGFEEYIEIVDPSFLENGFHETELSKEVVQFRNVAHVFSTYESRRTVDGDVIARGINSIQLFFDNERWYVVSVFWASENPDNPIPEKYLKGN